MKNVIYYFTGTGNSLKVAKDIANQLGDTKLISISKAIKETEAQTDYERVGFIFPVYYFGVPSIVKEFIDKSSFSQSEYIFSVITYGGSHSKTFTDLDSYIIPRGGKLSAGFAVPMPGNYIVKYGAIPLEKQKQFFSKESETVKQIAGIVQKKASIKAPVGLLVGVFFKGLTNKMLNKTKDMAVNFRATEKCSGCGTCERICPIGNITLVEKRPEWGKECQMCVACIQWCPQEAIEYSNVTKDRKRYHNPYITITDMI